MESPKKSGFGLIIEERITKVNGDFHIKRYAQGNLLGKGGFAKVYAFTNLETQKIFAGKVMPKVNFNKSRSRQKLMSEIKLHKSLHHPNIVNFEYVFEDQDNIYIILELCTNQSLNDLLKRRKKLTEFEVQCYLIQMVDALKYLHANRIIHRDLKLGNIFLNDKMQAKLGDFGLAAKLEFDGEKKRTVCGTPNYIAPEILDGNIGHSYEVDIWSLGVILYILIIGKPPFETSDIKLTYKKIKENNYSFPDNAPISENAKDLISKLLVKEPEKRLTLDEILLHPFIDHGGPIPKLMPTSTLACPPTKSYMKQFAPSKTSQRVRITTEPEEDHNEILKLAKGHYINTARPSQMPMTPSGKNLPVFDFFAMTPRTPKIDLRRTSERTNPFFSTMGDEKLGKSSVPQTPTNVFKQFFQTQTMATEENDEELIPRKKEEKKENKKPSIQAYTNLLEGIRVAKWYDYTSKYGLGYKLTNGAVGVSFNDGAKMITAPNESFVYIVRRSSDKKEVQTTYISKEAPQELEKRVLVLNHFKKHFAFDSNSLTDQFCFVKKWIATKHGVFFRLSNEAMQVSFKDESILTINMSTKKVIFVHHGVTSSVPLESASMSEDKELTKRLKYTEEVLKNIWSVQNGTQATPTPTNQKLGDVPEEPEPELELPGKPVNKLPLDQTAKTASTTTASYV